MTTNKSMLLLLSLIGLCGCLQMLKGQDMPYATYERMGQQGIRVFVRPGTTFALYREDVSSKGDKLANFVYGLSLPETATVSELTLTIYIEPLDDHPLISVEVESFQRGHPVTGPGGIAYPIYGTLKAKGETNALLQDLPQGTEPLPMGEEVLLVDEKYASGQKKLYFVAAKEPIALQQRYPEATNPSILERELQFDSSGR